MPHIHDFTGPIQVTLIYIIFYYGLQVHAVRVKSRLRRQYADRGEKFDRYFGQDRQMLAVDRYIGNTLEHMPPFLILMWLHAVFVSAATATIAGGVYVATRIAYPFVIGRRLGRGIKRQVLPVTFTGYGVLAYLAASLVFRMFTA